MNNSEQFLIITLNKNKKDECEIPLNEVESIEKIKEDCKQKLGFGNIDINKINLFFIDDNEDRNIINEFNDLIEYSNINSEDNLSIELVVEINEEKERIINNQNKENNTISINNNKKNINKIIIDDKDRKINELNAIIEKLIMKLQKYKDKLKELIDKYEKKISDLKKLDPKKENRELIHENITIKTPNENINNINLKSNNINTKERKSLYIEDILYINIKCNKCKKKNNKNIFQCVYCENYFLCQDCHNKNNKEAKKFHDHEYLYFFEIIFPIELMTLIKRKKEKKKVYYEVIDKFNDFLTSIFFDEDKNFSNKKYNIDIQHIENLKSLCNDMIKFNEDPFKYFEDYKQMYINPKIENIEKDEKEEKQKEILISIGEKLQLIWLNLMSCTPKKENNYK